MLQGKVKCLQAQQRQESLNHIDGKRASPTRKRASRIGFSTPLRWPCEALFQQVEAHGVPLRKVWRR
ncbi:MAG: hypothetical protein RIQ68_131 [Pseudomonadota bacterium]